MADVDLTETSSETDGSPGGLSRRRFIGYLIAGPTVIAAAKFSAAPAAAAIPTVQFAENYDLSDLLKDSTRPTWNLIRVAVNQDGTASFALPRAEVGQGLTTSVAMIIADELSLPLEKVKLNLADANPDLVWNQFTGGSNSIICLYEPVRTAAAVARGALIAAAAAQLRVAEERLDVRDGVISAPDGRSLTYGSLATAARALETRQVSVQLKPRSQLRLVGTGQTRVEAREMATGQKLFAMDIDVPNALPTIICRPPTINGTTRSVKNMASVKSMPGITDVAVIRHTALVQGGVAVRGRTFGQCIDAVRALEVNWGPGSVDGASAKTVADGLRRAELPMPPALPGKVVEDVFTFNFRPGDPLETNNAIADVRADRAEVWACCKSPILTKQNIAEIVGLPADRVTLHVAEGGGSFGRHLYSDAVYEAAAVSKAMGKPVKLMWHRTDNFRHGRVHPMARSRVRVIHDSSNVLSFDQRHTSVMCDFSHGFGEALSHFLAIQPNSNFVGYSQTVWNLTSMVAYNFGAVTQMLNETGAYNTFNTGPVRNIYSPDQRTAVELMVDRTAKSMGKDPLAFRREFVKDGRMRAVLDAVAKAGNWGRSMPAGTAQGLGIHREYKGFAACLAEIDTRDAQVNRKIRHAYTGPRVTKVVFAVDVGLPINVLGLKAQMMGGIIDGIAQVLTYSLHLEDGHFLEGSWDDAFYTRQWNTPPEVEVIVMPATTNLPGGAGEFGVAAAMAAVANAYARATGTNPTTFPINHDRKDLGFEPFPTTPPIPQSPTNGYKRPRTRKKKPATRKRG